jgi:putative ABC transport system substrate-binding protein
MSAFGPKRASVMPVQSPRLSGYDTLSMGLGINMKRREFIALLCNAVAVVHDPAFAQADRIRLVGVLLSQFEGSQEAKGRITAVREELQKLGWTEGRNIRIEAHYANGNADRMRAQAAELVKLGPDVLLASATASLAALQKATSTIPIVFAQVTDPVGAGFVKSLARPGGNITGFTQQEFSIGVKWLELLKELAPQTEQVAILYDPQNPATTGYRQVIKASAPQFQVQISEYPVREAVDIERAVATIAGKSNSGLIILPGPSPSVQHERVVALLNQRRLPAVYPFRYWVTSGGLAFYGIDNIELYRQAATYVDRILKGEKPVDLPVQNATKFELVINLKTAKELGINPSNSLLARTDEVIE